tara:strand:- start:36 stop:179 length:144 start_codon:yes stop_codon:yes gene_type:complete
MLQCHHFHYFVVVVVVVVIVVKMDISYWIEEDRSFLAHNKDIEYDTV